MTKPRIPYGLDGAWLGPHDAGLGSIRPEQTVGLGPHDAGLGSIRPEQTVGLGPHDAGLGSIRPEQTVGLGPHDAGLGSIRPEQTVGSSDEPGSPRGSGRGWVDTGSVAASGDHRRGGI